MSWLALVYIVLASASGVPPIELFGCFTKTEKRVEVLRVREREYQCKFGWRQNALAGNIVQVGGVGAVTIEMTGFTAAELHLSYDKFRLKKVAIDQHKPGSMVRLLELGGPIQTQAEQERLGTWFTLNFNYTHCIGDDAAPINLVVAPLGNKTWAPIVTELHQDREACHSNSSFGHWFAFMHHTSDAAPKTLPLGVTSRGDGSAAFAFIFMLSTLLALCMVCFYINPSGVGEAV